MDNITTLDQTENTVNIPTHSSLADQCEKARIPEFSGIAAEVFRALEQQIGEGPLSMTQVSEELKVSGRTLQRHLQKENVSFYEIREKLRHNKSILMLMDEKKAIKDIYHSLGFTDRTGFSKAFKRWTTLSPDVFRRLYKDEDQAHLENLGFQQERKFANQ